MQVVIFTSPERGDMLANVVREFAGYDIAIIGAKETFGIDQFWKRWEQARKLCLDSPHDNYLIISDDGSKHDIEAITTLHKRLGSTQYTCAAISDDRLICWGSVPSSRLDIVVHGYGYTMKHIDFFDCGGLTNRKTLELFEVTETNRRGISSSGVGKQITKKLRALGVPMYKTEPSLSYHGTHASVMHPELRKKQPLISQVKQDDVIIGMATFNGREKQLAKAIRSLEGQATRIVLYDNDDGDNPDLADNGKFWELQNITRPTYVLLCDDDIIYPPTYVRDMIEAIDRLGYIVTHHGRKLRALDVSYYRGHQSFACKQMSPKELPIDVAGTGVTGFHTSYFHPKNLHASPNLKMADLVFSLEAAKKGKKIMLLKHPANYFSIQKVDEKTAIFNTEIKKESKQIQLANEILKIKG